MKRRKRKIALNLDKESIDFLKAVAKLANVSVDTVIAVLVSAKIVGAK